MEQLIFNNQLFTPEGFSEFFPDYLARLSEGEIRYVGYEKAVDHAEEMDPIVFGTPPAKLLKTARPNERKEITDYRLEVYEPVVKSHYSRVCNVMATVWNPQHYEIKWPETVAPGVPEEENSRDFFTQNYHNWKSLVRYVSGPLKDNTLADPNAVVWSDPNPQPEGFPEPWPVLFPASHVVDYVHGERVVVLAWEKSIIDDGTKKVPEGDVFYIFLPDMTIIAEQVGSKKKLEFRVREVDVHDLGMIPARKLGGVSKTKLNVSWDESLIAGVLPSWNTAIRRGSDFEAMMINHLVAQRVRMNTRCNTCHGKGFEFYDKDDKAKCRACDGTGIQIAVGPYQDIVVDPQNELGLKPTEIIAYVQQDIEHAEYIEGQIDRLWESGMKALVMDVVNKVGTNQSGRAKDMDQTHLKQFLGIVSEHDWDMYEWLLTVQVKQRYGWIMGTDREGVRVPDYPAAMESFYPAIERPFSFDNNTLETLLANFKILSESKVHPAITRAAQLDVIGKKYGDTETAKRLKAEIMLDPYAGNDPDAKLAINARQNMDRISGYVSDNLSRLLVVAEAANPDFFDLERADQMAVLVAIAKAELASELEDGGVTNNDAEAQARIRGSVGGVTAIVQLATAVAKGDMSEEAAESTLVRIYGLSHEEARDIIQVGEIQQARQIQGLNLNPEE